MASKWVPLEANPDVLNTLAENIGVDLQGQGYAFQDVYGLDDELLAMIPQPVLAVILLYPLTEEHERQRLQEIQEHMGIPEGERCKHHGEDLPFYMKQTIGNACGTIALLHCLGNSMTTLSCDPNGFLHQFLDATSELSHAKRGEYLENGKGAALLERMHEEAAQTGNTRAPSVDDVINLHFVAFVEHSGGLWELDGRKVGPVYHGKTERISLLQDAARVIKKEYIETSQSLDFNMMALAASE